MAERRRARRDGVHLAVVLEQDTDQPQVQPAAVVAGPITNRPAGVLSAATRACLYR